MSIGAVFISEKMRLEPIPKWGLTFRKIAAIMGVLFYMTPLEAARTNGRLKKGDI